ncbi:hypothetical protein H6P81_020870 [Aristolochia fimbriata]|uniref:Uncharacterized protein n=1 Tax=Aristolochia fimbriata TaxID=158543 RepID=A0AAV7DVM0_ARIFI|nr:hypothetical protein H6P81_020870 [Aristolochia fimbriata]
MALQSDPVLLEDRPGILVIGPCNVGKRTLLSRLLAVDLSDASDSSSEVLCHGWTIDTKYYTADLAIWMMHLDEEFSLGSLPVMERLGALVMVFDMSDLSSFTALQDWVSHNDIVRFEILLCIGNKADLLPGHFAHVAYRRKLLKHGESSSDPHPEYLDYGIHESEGSSLLEDEEPSGDFRRSCLEWCSQNNIEFLEACASNPDFDKCLSVDGDSQGVDRLYGALSAHMWPGMVLKSGNMVPHSVSVKKEDITSDEESDLEIEYEILSKGSAEPWDDLHDLPSTTDTDRVNGNTVISDVYEEHETRDADAAETSTSRIDHEADTQTSATTVPTLSDCRTDILSHNPEKEEIQESLSQGLEWKDSRNAPAVHDRSQDDTTAETSTSEILAEEDTETKASIPIKMDEDTHVGMEDLEHLMCEISHMRENLRLMPDFQRKEMAAKLAMKMAAMFADSSDEDEDGFN